MSPGSDALLGLKWPEPIEKGVAGFPVSSVIGFPVLSVVLAARINK